MNKKCTKCNITKHMDFFYRNKYSNSGSQSHCKECHNKTTSKWRKNNPDKYSKYNCSKKRSKAKQLESKMRSRKQRLNMADRYIRDILTMGTNLKPEDISNEMVEIHRINLALKRQLGLTKKLKS